MHISLKFKKVDKKEIICTFYKDLALPEVIVINLSVN